MMMNVELVEKNFSLSFIDVGDIEVRQPSLSNYGFVFIKMLVEAYETNNEAQKWALLESIDPAFAEYIYLEDFIGYLDKINSEAV